MLAKSEMPKTEGELPLMRRIKAALEQMGVMVWRNHVGAARIDGRWQRFGEKGSPDLLCVVGGKFIGIEVKRPGEKPTPEQIAWGRRLELNGGIWVLARSIDEAIVPVMEAMRG